MQWFLPVFRRQVEEFALDMERIRYVVISHSHFDHCGLLPYIKERYPHIKVVGSRGAQWMFENEKARKNMKKFSDMATQQALGHPMPPELETDWESIRIDLAVGDGDVLDLGGGVRLEFTETPGHSRCSLSAYEPGAKILFPGDSLHVPSEDGTAQVCTASESFTHYEASLRKLDPSLRVCAWEHHGAFLGKRAERAISDGIAYTQKYRRHICEALGAGTDREVLAQQLFEEWMDRSGFYFMPRTILMHIMRDMITHAEQEGVS